MKLYELTEQYMDLLDMLETEAGNEEIAAMLNGMEEAIADKVENICKVMKSLEGEEKVIDEEVKRLSQRKSHLTARREHLKRYIENELTKSGIEKLKGTLFNVWLQNNPPSVIVTDEASVPREYFVTPAPLLQKKSLLEALKGGQAVPGVELRQEKSLRVR